MLGEKHDLTHVVGMMGQLPIERLDDRMALSPDVDVAEQIVGLQRIERREEH